MSVSAVISACQVSGSPSIIALVRSWLRLGPALDEVGGQRERRARETDQRHVAQRGGQLGDRGGHRQHLLVLQRRDRADVGEAPREYPS